MKHKERLDVVLVERGLCDSRSKAQALIMSGEVYVNGQKSDKAGTPVEDEAVVELRGNPCPYVSRGGLKLEKALRDFGVDRDGDGALGGVLGKLPELVDLLLEGLDVVFKFKKNAFCHDGR